MKFFKTQRKKSLLNKINHKYILYAFGEILIIFIGIFIGLQVNKWNEKSISLKKINNYYIKINKELKFTQEQLEYSNKFHYKSIENLTFCLKKINERKLDTLFFSKIKSISSNYSENILTPITNEFIKQDFSGLIKNLKLRENFQLLNYFINLSKIEDERMIRFDEELKRNLINKISYLEIDEFNVDNSVFKFEKIDFIPSSMNREDEYYKIEMVNLIYYKIILEKDRIATNGNTLAIIKNILKTTANNQ